MGSQRVRHNLGTKPPSKLGKSGILPPKVSRYSNNFNVKLTPTICNAKIMKTALQFSLRELDTLLFLPHNLRANWCEIGKLQVFYTN